MKVRILIGVNAYACIEDGPRSLDVLLTSGRSAPMSLRQSADEMREKAAQLVDRAAVLNRAADYLENERAKP